MFPSRLLPSARNVSLPRLAAVVAAVLVLGGEGPDQLTSKPRPAVPAFKTLPVGEEVRTAAGQKQRVGLAGGVMLYVNEKTTVKRIGERRLEVAAGEVFVEAVPVKDAAPVEVRTPRREVKGTLHFAVRVGDDGTGVLVAGGRAVVSGLDAPLTAGQQLPPRGDRAVPAPRVSHLLGWTRELMTSAEGALVPSSPHAGGSLVVRDPDGQEARLALRKYHVDVHVEDGFARTTIDQTYFNHTHGRLEGTFYFPLPADASLSRLAMYVDGKLNEGGMVERDYGRQVYERIVHQQRDPALLEWLDGTTFKMRVFPLEPRQEKCILLSYSQKLPNLYGQAAYRFPAGHTLDAVRDFSVHVRFKNSAKVGWSSPSHAFKASTDGADLLLDAGARNTRLDRDVVLSLSEGPAGAEAPEVRFSSAEHEGSRYLMVRYRPGLAGRQERQRRDWVFLFESSGDRDPLLARTQIEIIRGLLANAGPDDTFNVLTANTRLHSLSWWVSRPITPDNVKEAIEFLEHSHLIGALDLGESLTLGSIAQAPPKDVCLVHVGSGIAAMGERRDEELVKRIPKGTQYVGVGVGKRWNRSLMKLAAERTGGYFTQINPDEPVSWRAFELAATLNTPRLLDVQVADKDGKATFLPFTRAAAQGEEIAAVARLGARDRLPETITVSGTLDGQPFVRELAVKDVAEKADYLPRTWAKLEIERLLAEDAARHKEKIVALSKAMYVMTPFTSLLVLENEEMYVQYKVDRGRKDHWALYPCPEKIEVVYEPEDGQPGDPKKGIKPSAKQVLKTVLTRGSPQVLEVSGKGDNPQVEPPETLYDLEPPDIPRVILSLDRDEAVRERMRGDFREHLGERRPPFLEEGTSINGTLLLGHRLQNAPRYIPPMGLPYSPGEPSGRRVFMTQEQLNTYQTMVPSNLINNPNAGPEPTLPLPPKPQTQSNLESPGSVSRAIRALDALEHTGFRQRTVAELFEHRQRIAALRSKIAWDREQTWISGINDAEQEGDSIAAFLSDSSDQPALLYQRPGYSGDDRLFFDLVAYAPGLNTTSADIRAVLDAEAAPDASSKVGAIDAAARTLLDKARLPGWRSLTMPADGDAPAWTITFDDRGRYAWERRLPSGLREQVVCDGKTLLHLYPDLGLAARRTVSRFHRLAFSRLVPWALPRAEDLARGADVRLVGEHTVAVVPHGAGGKDGDGKPVPYFQVQFLLAPGAPAERQVVEMPDRKVLVREVFAPNGTMKVIGEDGKETAVIKGILDDAKTPNLKPDLEKLVVLQLPYRIPDQVRQAGGVEKKSLDALSFEDGRALLATEFAAGNGNEAAEVFKRCFHGRDQRQLGYYVLLVACGQNLDAEHLDVLAEHPDEPLAQYLALHSSPVLRKHASQWAAGGNHWNDDFLQRLALAHALLQRFQAGRSVVGRPADLDRALAFVRKHRGSALSWAIMALLADRARDDEARKKDVRAVHEALAKAWPLFNDVPGLQYASRYEEARSLFKSGHQAEARKRFAALYEETLKDGILPAIDADLPVALLSVAAEVDPWNDLMRRTAARLVKEKHRLAVLLLARQCWQLGDHPLANGLYAQALQDLPAGKERMALRLAGLEFLCRTGQLAEADDLLREMLNGEGAKKAALWRLGARLAQRRDMPAREWECLEKALDLEFQQMPDVVDLGAVRSDYERLLTQYQAQAQSLAALKLTPPGDFRAKVIRTADRWRALDRDAAQACTLAARTLQLLGDRDAMWDYLTTPVGQQPNESGPWAELGRTLARQGDLVLADRAYAAAFEAEPTNAQLLWDRARNLSQAGRVDEAQKLYRRLAESTWQPRFGSLQTQARWQLERR